MNFGGIDQGHGGDGNDVIIGGPAWSDNFSGDAGNDVLLPYMARLSPLGNTVQGGAGNDLAILLNGFMDGFTRGEDPDIPIPLLACQLKAPLIQTITGGPLEGKIECPLLDESVQVSVDTQHHIGLSGTAFAGFASFRLEDLVTFSNDHHSEIQSDICICDPDYGLTYLFHGDLLL